MRDWVKMPSLWIEQCGLTSFNWKPKQGPNNIAALMVYISALHRMDSSTGELHATYDDLVAATSLSRSKVSAGIKVLQTHNLMQRYKKRRSFYQISNYEPKYGWAMFPAKRMYSGYTIRAFKDFNLRKRTELDALKILLLVASRRDNTDNLAHITYDQIEEMSAVHRNYIASALSLLSVHSLVYKEQLPSSRSDFGVSNAYRLPLIRPYTHGGTVGRQSI